MYLSQKKANKKYRAKVIHVNISKETHAKLKKISILANLPITQIIDALVDYYEESEKKK